MPLVAAAAVSLAALLMLAMVAQLIAEHRRAFRASAHDRARHAWADRWIDVVFSGAEAPSDPLPPAAVDSLLDLRESLTGEPAQMVTSLVRNYNVDTKLIDDLRRTPSLRRVGRLETLEDLGRARSPAAIDALFGAAATRQTDERLMSVRALSRCVAEIGDDDTRRAVAGRVATTLREAPLALGTICEALELLGPAGRFVIAEILTTEPYDERMVTAALDSVGRTGPDAFADDIVRFASSPDACVRLAALHAMTKLERLPAGADAAIERAFGDDSSGIRVEAARAARLLDPFTAINQLEDLLCDQDWTVRRVAATTLASMGGPGIRTLIATALVHADPRAKNIATQVLLESRSPAELGAEQEKVG